MMRIIMPVAGATAATLGFGSVALASAQAESWLRVATLGIGLVGGVVAMVGTYRMQRLQLAKAETTLCQDCLKGSPPDKCPVPASDRPKNCPLATPTETKVATRANQTIIVSALVICLCLLLRGVIINERILGALSDSAAWREQQLTNILGQVQQLGQREDLHDAKIKEIERTNSHAPR